MKKIILSIIVLAFSVTMFSQNVAVSTITADWFPQLNQAATNLVTPDGWYYRTNLTSERLAFDGTIQAGTAIVTTFGSIGAPYIGMSIKFDATMPAPNSGKSTIIVLGSNASWGGQGIVLEYTEFGVRALKDFNYSAMTWIGSGSEYTTALGTGGLIANNEINISATGLITLKFGTFVCPTSYQADVTVLASGFVLVSPFATGFKFKNVIAKKAGVAKSYFPNYSYAINVTANDAAKGSVSGAGTFDKTSDVTLTASPTSGNMFIKWTEGGVDVSTANPLTFSATVIRTLVAVFDVSTGLDHTKQNNMGVYPNPTKGEFTLSTDEVGKEYRINNLLGQHIAGGMVTSKNQKIDVSNQKAGTYMIVIQGENGKMVKTILKN